MKGKRWVGLVGTKTRSYMGRGISNKYTAIRIRLGGLIQVQSSSNKDQCPVEEEQQQREKVRESNGKRIQSPSPVERWISERILRSVYE